MIQELFFDGLVVLRLNVGVNEQLRFGHFCLVLFFSVAFKLWLSCNCLISMSLGVEEVGSS